MACVIDSTVGGTDANSYISIADANAYHDTHPYSSVWDGASTDEKCRALVTATRLLDTWYVWEGDVASSDQALLWPRDGVIGPNGYEEDSDAIPIRIQQGTAELARQLLTSDRTADSELETQGIQSLKAGSVALTFRSVVAKPIPDAVASLVSFYGVKQSATGGAVHLYRA